MEIILFLVTLVLASSIVVYFIFQRQKVSNQNTLMLQQQIDNLRKDFNEQLMQVMQQVSQQITNMTSQMFNSQKTVSEKLDTASILVGEVKHSLGALSQAAERIYEIGKDMAELQEILSAPKLRGTLGELLLKELLLQILPEQHYNLQYTFKSGEKVDAVIHLGDRLVSVDAKFPLEDFRRIFSCKTEEEKKVLQKKFRMSVKKHVDDISTKYIVPEEGTFDFALMYIPAENIYYEAMIRDDSAEDIGLFQYALQKKVIPVSPNSFYAYLQTIILGLRGLKIEKSAKEVVKYIQQLQVDFSRFNDEFQTLGRHITNAKTKFDEVERKLNKFSDRLLSAADKPSFEDKTSTTTA